MFPEFIQYKRGDASIWVDQRLADQHFVDRLADADQLFSEASCQIIKDQRKIRVGRLRVNIAGVPRVIYIKRYNAFSLRHALISPFMCSGAFHALQGAAILRAANIPSAVPIAAVENRFRRTITKSFFITEEICDGKTIDAYWREELASLGGCAGFSRRRAFLRGLAGLFANLHRQGIYHNDLKDANILAVGHRSGVRFFLLDLEGVRRHAALSENRRVKNLVQLYRTLGRELRRADKLIFLKAYLGAAFAGRQARRRLIENLLSKSNRLDAVKGRRSAGRGRSKARHG